MVRKKLLFFDSPLGLLFLGIFLVCAGAACFLAVHVGIETFEGYSFLTQARRLSQEGFAEISHYDHRSPRFLVMLLAAFDWIYSLIFFQPPPLSATHLLMVVVAFCFVFIWVVLIARFVGRREAYIVGILICVSQAYLHYSFSVNSGFISGLLLALLFYTFLRKFSGIHPDYSVRCAVLLGALGIALGLSQHHFFPLWPFLITLWWLASYRRNQIGRELTRWALFSLLSFFLLAEVLTRFSGTWREGVSYHLYRIWKQVLHSVGDPSTFDLYATGLNEMYGPGIWIVLLLSVLLLMPTGFQRIFKNRATACVSIAFIFFLLLLQFAPHKELLYLFPFLPGILIPVALSVTRAYDRPGRSAKIAIVSLGILALLPGIYRSYLDFDKFRTDPVYDDEQSGLNEFWSTLDRFDCKEIAACQLRMEASPPWEFPKDAYYRRYDFGPNYSYRLGVRARWGKCKKTPLEKESAVLSELVERSPDADCFIYPREDAQDVILSKALKCKDPIRYPECFERASVDLLFKTN